MRAVDPTKKMAHKTGRGCDIGYAPAASSCEGVHSVDTCTVAAIDEIAALAAPNPGSSSQSQPSFSGLVARSGHPAEQITQLLRAGKFDFVRLFSRRGGTS